MRLSAIFRSTFLHFILLIALTVFLAAICFRDHLYSPLFSRQRNLRRLSRDFLHRNLQDGSEALQHFHQMVSASGTFPPNTSIPCAHKPAGNPHPSGRSGSTPLVVTIITTRRRTEYHYLLQVARGFLDRISECGQDCSSFQVLVCNVDPFPEDHSDACLLSHLLPTVARHRIENVDEAPNRFEQEKRDYAFCLSHTLEAYNPDYVLLVEDDAVPLRDIFHAFFHLVQVRFPKEPLGGGLYLKMYHPERLQGYLNPEPMRILEWIGLGGLAGLVLTWVFTLISRQQHFSWRLFVIFAIYAMLLTELAGRHYLLELRRISPALYNVVPVTECCTPAMLFSDASARRTLSYLKEIECKPGHAKDIALYQELRRRGDWAWALEPNMVTHVGMFSTLRGSFEGDEPQLL